MAQSWRCPFCGRDTTLNTSDLESKNYSFDGRKHGQQLIIVTVVRCPNPSCGEFQAHARMGAAHYVDGRSIFDDVKATTLYRLRPRSSAQQLPEYLPQPIREDYDEACLIVDLSPKASATLSRRALQGMIRDFWNVAGKKNLYQEINAIKDKVDPTTWEAIDAVRKLGNIGAHMEKDINVVAEVEPDEASRLIWLIETLVKDWYVYREERTARLEALKFIADAKAGARNPAEQELPEKDQSESD